MSTTRGVLFVHSAPSALCPHIDWAVGGIFGVPVRLDWIPSRSSGPHTAPSTAGAGPRGPGRGWPARSRGGRRSGSR